MPKISTGDKGSYLLKGYRGARIEKDADIKDRRHELLAPLTARHCYSINSNSELVTSPL